jgi:hypothetical protein
MTAYVIREDKGLEEAYTKKEVNDLVETLVDAEETSTTYDYTGA